MPTDYAQLVPDLVLSAVEDLGFVVDARILALNSYENRVYRVGIEDAPAVVVKFYRPGRWTDEAILEDHAFSQSLAAHELPVVAPWKNENNESLHYFQGYRFSVYPCCGGYAPEAGRMDELQQLGRLIGRIHACGSSEPFEHRGEMNIETFARRPKNFLLEQNFLPFEYESAYRQVVDSIIELSESIVVKVNAQSIRCHGDCHVGNILWTPDQGPHFVDLDDCLMAPAVQDLWMLTAGTPQEQNLQMQEILLGYSQFHDFNYAELKLTEVLRSLRMIHYAGWLAKRWQDPAFPLHFPWFNQPNYWAQHVAELNEQLILLNAAANAV